MPRQELLFETSGFQVLAGTVMERMARTSQMVAQAISCSNMR